MVSSKEGSLVRNPLPFVAKCCNFLQWCPPKRRVSILATPWSGDRLISGAPPPNYGVPLLLIRCPHLVGTFFGGMRLMHTLSFRRSGTHCQRKALSVRKTYRQWDNLYPVPQMWGNSRFVGEALLHNYQHPCR